MRKSIPFLKPNLVKKETYMKYLDVIDETRIYSNYGNLNTQFEKRILSEYFQNKGAVSTVSNATIGLMLSIMLSKRKKGRYAIMPSFTFSATAQAALWCGLEPLFIDIRSKDWCMDEKLVQNYVDKLGEEIAVIVPYATFGTVVDLSYYQNLMELGVPVVVDAAASFGSTYDGLGLEATFSGPIVYSFHATKAFGIGEGGLVYSQDEAFIEQLRKAGNFGFGPNRNSEQIGLNSKLTEYAAAIGLASLDKYPEKILIRQEIRRKYEKSMKEVGLFDHGWQLHLTRGNVAHQNVSVLSPDDCNAIDVVSFLEQSGIEARTYFSPACHQQSLFLNSNKSIMETTENIARRIINLPLWEEISDQEIDFVVGQLRLFQSKQKEVIINS
ncbi:aminotransferase class I/II-fold pyridoxal phosphate-dependent enzyme [Paenibacillus sp. HJL G12]|uniref:Aminotransferase class I/II-fold pyridoxal phosphate-dependent enzyme n=1 Tax=Paenibacillus dendrobii TaxID=2691084 RepID=A0A7X3IPP1_9BACL|nr:aminotransferase class I/II-fold pyridoxal phosphate-dependent enzyme [Paenibacillus dendrobii]MWV46620.1 aminotransferase class I/II-fold pyridoxal phosphate-dependent enzyme [Paenibacillus dendrobii]